MRPATRCASTIRRDSMVVQAAATKSKPTTQATASSDKTGLRIGAVAAAGIAAGAIAFHHFVIVPNAIAASGVEFAGISSNATVSAPIHLEFIVSGKTVAPASEGLKAGTGHFHLLIDSPSPPEGETIPFDDAHKHYGKGQLSDDVSLATGKHQLTLQFADAQHRSYGPLFAKTISVNVK